MEAKENLDVWWFLHTLADVSLDADLREATLMLNGKKLRVKIEEGPLSMNLGVMDAGPLPTSPNPDQADNTGIKKLFIHADGLSQYQLRISFTPV
jgi:hypothetical protein